MLDYPSFCYLDVEKTGSTFIRAFLIEHAKGAARDATQHRVPRWAFRGRKFYFASARDPFDSYASLYSFGCAGKGVFRNHLERAGHPLVQSYDYTLGGFHQWLEAVLGPERQAVMPPSVQAYWSPHVGLMGLRFLRQTLPRARMRLRSARGKEGLSRLYAAKGLPRAVIRQEHLAADLSELIRGPLRAHIKDPQAALAALSAGGGRTNASDRRLTLREADLPPALAERLSALEWFHRETLGYAAQRG